MATPVGSRQPHSTSGPHQSNRLSPLDLLGGAISNLGAVFLAAVTIVVLIGVVARYVLSISLPWAEEVARLLLVWLTFMGAAAATYKRTNIRVDTIYARFKPGPVRLGFEMLSIGLTIFALVVLAWASRSLLTGPSAEAISPGSGIEARWTRIALPIASVAMIVFLLAELRWVVTNRQVHAADPAGEREEL